jgi:hypothetical protein
MAASRRSAASDAVASPDSPAPPIPSTVVDSWIADVASRVIGDDFAPTLDGKLADIGIEIDDLYELLQHETIDYPELVPILEAWQAEYARTRIVSLDAIAQRAGWKAPKLNGLLHEILYAYDETQTQSLVSAMRPVIIKRSLINAMTDAEERERWMQRFGYFPTPKSQQLVGDTTVSVNVNATATSDAKAGSVASNLPFLADDLDRTQKLTRGKQARQLVAAPEAIDIAVSHGDDSNRCSAQKSSRRRSARSKTAT